jgi:hypothetical protein
LWLASATTRFLLANVKGPGVDLTVKRKLRRAQPNSVRIYYTVGVYSYSYVRRQLCEKPNHTNVTVTLTRRACARPWEVVATLRPFPEIRQLSAAEDRVARRNRRRGLRGVGSRPVREILGAGWDPDPARRPTSALVSSRIEEILASQDGGAR